jgi:hypothetical protein
VDSPVDFPRGTIERIRVRRFKVRELEKHAVRST